MRTWTALFLLASILAAQGVDDTAEEGTSADEAAADDTAFSVAGTVVTSKDKPADAMVHVWDALAPDRLLASGRTDEDGQFSVEVSRSAAARREHPFGLVSVVVHQPGWAQSCGTVWTARP